MKADAPRTPVQLRALHESLVDTHRQLQSNFDALSQQKAGAPAARLPRSLPLPATNAPPRK